MSRPERKRGYPRHKRQAPSLPSGQHLSEGVSAVDMEAVLKQDWTRAPQVWAAQAKERAKGERWSCMPGSLGVPWVYPPDFDNARNRRRERRQALRAAQEE